MGASLLEVVGELGAGGPVAIVVDDLQWADRRSVEALTLLGALPAGSYLAVSHPASDIEAEAQGEMVERLNQTMAEKVTMRDRAQVARFFDGLELVEPGLVRVPEWRPESELEARSPAGLWGAVGRKN